MFTRRCRTNDPQLSPGTSIFCAVSAGARLWNASEYERLRFGMDRPIVFRESARRTKESRNLVMSLKRGSTPWRTDWLTNRPSVVKWPRLLTWSACQVCRHVICRAQLLLTVIKIQVSSAVTRAVFCPVCSPNHSFFLGYPANVFSSSSAEC